MPLNLMAQYHNCNDTAENNPHKYWIRVCTTLNNVTNFKSVLLTTGVKPAAINLASGAELLNQSNQRHLERISQCTS